MRIPSISDLAPGRSEWPVKAIHRNILIGHGDTYSALYRVPTVSYQWLPAAEKRTWFSRLAQFAYSIESDFSLYRVNRAYPIARYVEQALHMHDERSAVPGAWESYLSSHHRHLSGQLTFVPEVYITVSLKPERKAALKGGVLQGEDRVSAWISRARGRMSPISGAEIKRLEAAEERAYRRGGSWLQLRKRSEEHTS